MSYDVTYVMIDTLNYKLSLYALEKSLEQFECRKVLIFSDDAQPWGGHDIIQIPKIRSTKDYNNIIFSELPKFLETSHALIIQYDGYVLSGDHFSSEFLNYDFIGAPWPHHRQFNVGNGGFSLRSKKLINAIKTYLLPEDYGKAEDVVICRYLRARLEDELGVIFAPKEVAKLFSYEMEQVDHETFGFHGLYNMPKVMGHDIDILFDNLSPQYLTRYFRAFNSCCESLPTREREMYYNFLRKNSDSLLSYAQLLSSRSQSA